ncbi:Tudor Domain-Containing Protein 5 [Manis pentadactyla]|nr:Tudor Domain-Containing Protein 5 [Manis pentadactyla]
MARVGGALNGATGRARTHEWGASRRRAAGRARSAARLPVLGASQPATGTLLGDFAGRHCHALSRDAPALDGGQALHLDAQAGLPQPTLGH